MSIFLPFIAVGICSGVSSALVTYFYISPSKEDDKNSKLFLEKEEQKEDDKNSKLFLEKEEQKEDDKNSKLFLEKEKWFKIKFQSTLDEISSGSKKLTHIEKPKIKKHKPLTIGTLDLGNLFEVELLRKFKNVEEF